MFGSPFLVPPLPPLAISVQPVPFRRDILKIRLSSCRILHAGKGFSLNFPFQFFAFRFPALLSPAEKIFEVFFEKGSANPTFFLLLVRGCNLITKTIDYKRPGKEKNREQSVSGTDRQREAGYTQTGHIRVRQL
jgi:hypothetical protein